MSPRQSRGINAGETGRPDATADCARDADCSGDHGARAHRRCGSAIGHPPEDVTHGQAAFISNATLTPSAPCQYSAAKARFSASIHREVTMRWTKVRKRFEELVAPSLRGRVQVHVTRYRETRGMDVGRGWITVNGEEVVSVQIPSSYTEHMKFSLDTLDFGRAVGTYVEISISAARSSPDPLLRGLAFLDRRVGKRSLASIDEDQLHAFEKALWVVRCRAEGIENADFRLR
jgi:hypothetical protein